MLSIVLLLLVFVTITTTFYDFAFLFLIIPLFLEDPQPFQFHTLLLKPFFVKKVVPSDHLQSLVLFPCSLYFNCCSLFRKSFSFLLEFHGNNGWWHIVILSIYASWSNLCELNIVFLGDDLAEVDGENFFHFLAEASSFCFEGFSIILVGASASEFAD